MHGQSRAGTLVHGTAHAEFFPPIDALVNLGDLCHRSDALPDGRSHTRACVHSVRPHSKLRIPCRERLPFRRFTQEIQLRSEEHIGHADGITDEERPIIQLPRKFVEHSLGLWHGGGNGFFVRREPLGEDWT